MSIFFRVNFLSLVLAFVTFSCSPAKPITPSTMTPVSQVASETPVLIAIPKQNDLIFIEFFAGTWIDCRKMEPIVHGLEDKYSSCMSMQRVNFHSKSVWREALSPIGTPEFVLLDSSEEIIYRWFGVTEEKEFATVLDSLCGG